MITRVTIKNLKRFEDVTVPLGKTIVFAGPNNSGKTTAIQALAVWRLALLRWLQRRGDKPKSIAKQRTGVPITRPDMTAVPTREMKLLWNMCKVMGESNKPRLIEILVEGITGRNEWKCGMELQYQGPEMLYCRPMRVAPDSDERMEIPPEVRDLIIAHLPPLAGLQLIEERVDERVLLSRISEGRAGDIIRNLLYNVAEGSKKDWEELKKHILELFQVELSRPEYLTTGEIRVEYYDGLPNKNRRNTNPKLDITNGGSGFHQVLLILAFLYGRQASVLLFDEPDAHLEIIRQKDVYKLIQGIAGKRDAQLLISTHSEVILDDTLHANILAFIGDKPRPLASDQHVSQLRKSLTRIPSSDYLLAEQRKGVLYVEDYTDIDILLKWAKTMNHEAKYFLSSPFAHYINNNVPAHARDHFYGLREAYPELKGVLLIDKTDVQLQEGKPLLELMWQRKEIENYLLVPNAILRCCEGELRTVYGGPENSQGSLFAKEIERGVEHASELLRRMLPPEVFENPLKDTEYVRDTKASEGVLERFFKEFFSDIGQYNTMAKNQLYKLAEVMHEDEIHPEVREKLDKIATLTPLDKDRAVVAGEGGNVSSLHQ